MSDSVRPHRPSLGFSRQEYWRPWDSPGKNTGVGCRFLLRCMKVKSLSRVQTRCNPVTVAYQALPSMGFSRHEYWSGMLFPSPGDLPDSGSEPGLPHCRQMLYHLSHRLMSIELMMPSNHLILCCTLLLLPSIFPDHGLFQ